MKSEHEYFRSPELMGVSDTVLVVVDVQEKLLPSIEAGERVEWNVGRLVDGAKVLGISCLATEQYPQGLGLTTETLREKLKSADVPVFSKTAFSGCGCDKFRTALRELSPARVLVCGMETHICVFQTAMDLLADGFRVLIVADAVGSRSNLDHHVSLRRLESEGATLTTTETSLFEWCESSEHGSFSEIRELVMLSL